MTPFLLPVEQSFEETLLFFLAKFFYPFFFLVAFPEDAGEDVSVFAEEVAIDLPFE